MAILELRNVSKDHGGTPVLKDISLSVDAGQFVAVLGFSGTGKTTLANALLAEIAAKHFGPGVLNVVCGDRVTGAVTASLSAAASLTMLGPGVTAIRAR